MIYPGSKNYALVRKCKLFDLYQKPLGSFEGVFLFEMNFQTKKNAVFNNSKIKKEGSRGQCVYAHKSLLLQNMIFNPYVLLFLLSARFNYF